MDSLNFNSVETLPNLSARAAFQVNSSAVFKEDVDIVPVVIDDTLSYMPWGGDNNMPFDILKLIEDDETLSTCQMFNAEVCYGNGLVYKYRPGTQGRGTRYEKSKRDERRILIRRKLRTSFLTMTSPHTISAYARTSSILAFAVVVVAACRHKCQQCERNDKGFQCKFYFLCWISPHLS